jgi:hypothetical protein
MDVGNYFNRSGNLIGFDFFVTQSSFYWRANSELWNEFKIQIKLTFIRLLLCLTETITGVRKVTTWTKQDAVVVDCKVSSLSLSFHKTSQQSTSKFMPLDM